MLLAWICVRPGLGTRFTSGPRGILAKVGLAAFNTPLAWLLPVTFHLGGGSDQLEHGCLDTHYKNHKDENKDENKDNNTGRQTLRVRHKRHDTGGRLRFWIFRWEPSSGCARKTLVAKWPGRPSMIFGGVQDSRR